MSAPRPISTPSRMSASTSDRGEFFGLAGESGCGKSTIAFAISRLHRPPALIRTGSQILRQRARRARPRRRGPAQVPLARGGDGVPERDELAQPGADHREPVLRCAQDPHRHVARGRPRARRRAAEARRHPAGPAVGLSAPALGRHAAAHRHRHLPRAQSKAPDHGRADHRARRRGAARDPPAHRHAAPGARLRGALHHPRPGPDGAGERPHRHHARGRAGRGQRRAGDLSRAAARLHAQALGLDAAPHRSSRSRRTPRHERHGAHPRPRQRLEGLRPRRRPASMPRARCRSRSIPAAPWRWSASPGRARPPPRA